MPVKLRTPCRQSGCPELVDSSVGYCDKHKGKQNRVYDADRYSDVERVIYRSQRWRALSIAKRRDAPLCEQCLKRGKIAPAVLVHHKIPIKDGGDPWALDNLESVCQSCQGIAHARKG